MNYNSRDVRNRASGARNVVQANMINGGVHFHNGPQSREADDVLPPEEDLDALRRGWILVGVLGVVGPIVLSTGWLGDLAGLLYDVMMAGHR